MVDITPFLPGLSAVQGKAVVARFDGGRLSSEGGLLALREIERRLGLADRLASGEELCSQSTVSRLENLPDLRALLRLGRALVEQYCSSFRAVPRRIVLDIDDTFDRVHGGQQLRLFNAYYDDYGFQPIVVFDGEGRFVTALLRPGKRPSGV